MRNKSKIIAFLLSVIPGLAHLYIGFRERAIIFFMIFSGLLFGSVGLSILTYSDDFLFIILLAYPIIWLIALVDMYSAWNGIIRKQLNNEEIIYESNNDPKYNKKTIALALSIIPGAGHMYLGYQKKGLVLMGAFFFSVFFMGWLGISALLFILPLIWFYSFFDAMHTIDGKNEDVNNQELDLPKLQPEWIGFGLIAIGIVIILERILYTLIPYEISRYIQTSIVSLIFIVLGFKILRNNKASKSDEIEDGEELED